MKGWRTVSLGEFAESVDYGVTASATQQPSGPKFLRITDIQNGEVNWGTVPWCECDARAAANSRLNPGDIVFARTGATTGKSFLIRECPEDAVFASYLIRVRVGDSVEPCYLSHFFNSPNYWAQITQNVRGVAQPGVNASTLKTLQIPLPPLPEQKRIAAVLDKADSIRRKRQEAVRLTEELLRSVFLEMFGDPVIENTRWPILTLESACEKITDGTHHSPPIQTTGVPYITAKHLKQYGLDFESDPWFISEDDHRQIFSRCNPRFGDVLYIKDGATTGLAAVNRYSYDFSMLSSLALLRPNAYMLEATYLCYWLNNPKVKQTMLGDMAGAAIRRLTLTKIKAVKIPIPPIKLQSDFARRVLMVENLKKSLCYSQVELETLFNSSMQRAFKGDL